MALFNVKDVRHVFTKILYYIIITQNMIIPYSNIDVKNIKNYK